MSVERPHRLLCSYDIHKCEHCFWKERTKRQNKPAQFFPVRMFRKNLMLSSSNPFVLSNAQVFIPPEINISAFLESQLHLPEVEF